MMDKELVNYYYESAKVVLKNGSFFGEKINIEDDKEVIACLFTMYLHENSLRKIFQSEREQSV
jgi:hypothetical protein